MHQKNIRDIEMFSLFKKSSHEEKNIRPKRVYLKETIIYYPKVDITYCIQRSSLEQPIKIKFKGDYFPDFYYIDLSSGTGVLKNNLDRSDPKDLFPDPVMCLPKEILPEHSPSFCPTPVFMMSNTYPDIIGVPSRINITCSDSSGVVSGRLKASGLHNPCLPENKQLQNSFQPLISPVPVKTGALPIYLKNKPSFEYLQTIYQNFLKCNDEKKLNQQYEITDDLCHIRAHFVSVILAHYGISSVKIFKVWDPKDWHTYEKHAAWDYHCATMILDNNQIGCVWEPWVGLNKTLLTFKEWVFQPNEPTPIYVSINNRIVIGDHANGKLIEGGVHFHSHAPALYIEAFQAIATSAIPNPPEKSISIYNNFLKILRIKNQALVSDEYKDEKNDKYNRTARR